MYSMQVYSILFYICSPSLQNLIQAEDKRSFYELYSTSFIIIYLLWVFHSRQSLFLVGDADLDRFLDCLGLDLHKKSDIRDGTQSLTVSLTVLVQTCTQSQILETVTQSLTVSLTVLFQTCTQSQILETVTQSLTISLTVLVLTCTQSQILETVSQSLTVSLTVLICRLSQKLRDIFVFMFYSLLGKRYSRHKTLYNLVYKP